MIMHFVIVFKENVIEIVEFYNYWYIIGNKGDFTLV
jgi:hypothetical protein